jgi:hypothetical protein
VYHQKCRICDLHIKAASYTREGQRLRFCQRCGRAHSLDAFEGARRSCRAQLAKHNARCAAQRPSERLVWHGLRAAGVRSLLQLLGKLGGCRASVTSVLRCPLVCLIRRRRNQAAPAAAVGAPASQPPLEMAAAAFTGVPCSPPPYQGIALGIPVGFQQAPAALPAASLPATSAAVSLRLKRTSSVLQNVHLPAGTISADNALLGLLAAALWLAETHCWATALPSGLACMDGGQGGQHSKHAQSPT